MTRVLITGLGPVSSIGIGAAAFESGLRAGHCGIRPIGSFDTTGFPRVLGGEVQVFDAGSILSRIEPEEWGRSSQFAAAAARLAARDAGLQWERIDPERVSVVIGTTSGEAKVTEMFAQQLVGGGFEGVDPDIARRLPADRLSSAVSAELDAHGESMTIATACSASNYALGYAYDLIVSGEADVVFSGGADSVCRWAHAGFLRLGAVAERTCSPFDRDRTGMVTAEGGSMLVLEKAELARARGAVPYAEFLGYASNCDATHMVMPNASSIADCISAAHETAGVKTGDVDYVCAHGTGTPANDVTEAQALYEAFGGDVPPVSSIKSMLGHTMGAASGFGAIASALAIARGFLPPTIGWSTPDPEMAWLDPIPNRHRQAPVRVAQNNGFAFGGNNAIVMLGAAS
ncbi:beta-ketoacyl-[acyl-carrier-protein] synthase family protein [Qaidamihabitans albus]|uniref:beta-ketoacyl-[acyl-carrier-protein] synthase family protein n=1 Tax=Qaidamihabitans albus TaxID=2795733 RepID=UPI0018F1F537|nr:beta-ketoacyl-[acyl-carrier-protein] synthase family protein [Qaidamihabitans albus]